MCDPMRLSGYIADIPTPFDANGTIDWAAFDRLCRRQIHVGASAIVVAETAGETWALTLREHQDLIRAAVAVSQKRVAVIAGAGSNSTAQAIELARQAEAAGADAIMSVVPYYNKPMQDGLAAHFSAIAAATALPIIVHDSPSRTARALADATMIRLAQSPQFAGLRDSSGDVTRLARLRPQLPPGFRLLCGDDATATAFMLQGGHGCVSLLANVVPDLCGDLADACLREQTGTIQDLGGRLAPLAAALAQDSVPAALKCALTLLGLMSPYVRLPVVAMDAPSKAAIATALAAIPVSAELVPRNPRRASIVR